MQQQDAATAPIVERGLPYKWKVLGIVVFGIFMVILDTTVVNVAFQTLRQEFGSNLGEAQWIISVYVLAIGISTPLAGFMADRFGIKRVYLTGLSIFVLGSLMAGFSPNIWLLVGARAIQGVGGGLALPLGIALLLRVFPVEEQGLALGIFGVAAIVAPAIGPILGGWLVDAGLWRWIFFINPPIGLVGVVLGVIVLRNIPSDRKPPLDVLGLITEIIGFGAILYASSTVVELGWSSPTVLTAFAIGILGLAAFAYVELFVAKVPLLDLRLYRKRVFLNASLLGYVSVIALFGAEFLMPLYLQSLRGITALQTGLILLPLAITGGISVTVAGRLYDKLGPRPLVGVGFTILIINTWQLSQVQPDTSIQWIMFLLALRGIALGLTVQTTLVTALSVVPLQDVPRGSSLTNATRNLVQAVGVALLATILASTISPQTRQVQAALQAAPPEAAGQIAHVGLCAIPTGAAGAAGPLHDALERVAQSGAAPGTAPGAATAAAAHDDQAVASAAQVVPAQQPNLGALVEQACLENVAGFERAYRITFFASIVALILGLMLPGWPRPWGGRRAADVPTVSH